MIIPASLNRQLHDPKIQAGIIALLGTTAALVTTAAGALGSWGILHNTSFWQHLAKAKKIALVTSSGVIPGGTLEAATLVTALLPFFIQRKKPDWKERAEQVASEFYEEEDLPAEETLNDIQSAQLQGRAVSLVAYQTWMGLQGLTDAKLPFDTLVNRLGVQFIGGESQANSHPASAVLRWVDRAIDYQIRVAKRADARLKPAPIKSEAEYFQNAIAAINEWLDKPYREGQGLTHNVQLLNGGTLTLLDNDSLAKAAQPHVATVAYAMRVAANLEIEIVELTRDLDGKVQAKTLQALEQGVDAAGNPTIRVNFIPHFHHAKTKGQEPSQPLLHYPLLTVQTLVGANSAVAYQSELSLAQHAIGLTRTLDPKLPSPAPFNSQIPVPDPAPRFPLRTDLDERSFVSLSGVQGTTKTRSDRIAGGCATAAGQWIPGVNLYVSGHPEADSENWATLLSESQIKLIVRAQPDADLEDTAHYWKNEGAIATAIKDNQITQIAIEKVPENGAELLAFVNRLRLQVRQLQKAADDGVTGTISVLIHDQEGTATAGTLAAAWRLLDQIDQTLLARAKGLVSEDQLGVFANSPAQLLVHIQESGKFAQLCNFSVDPLLPLGELRTIRDGIGADATQNKLLYSLAAHYQGQIASTNDVEKMKKILGLA